jgi:uncharacterized membrane protein YeaQ/YmgE (transglycosylase-associated protein family)
MKEVLILILGCLFGSISTFWLQKNGCSAVVASASVGLIGASSGHLLFSITYPIIYVGSSGGRLYEFFIKFIEGSSVV